jgi:hypothetical protein
MKLCFSTICRWKLRALNVASRSTRLSNGSRLRVGNVPFAGRSSKRQSFDVELMRLQIVLMKCFRTFKRAFGASRYELSSNHHRRVAPTPVDFKRPAANRFYHHVISPKFRSPKLSESGCWLARTPLKTNRAIQTVPLGRLPPGKSGTPPCKSGQLKKDLGLEVSSPRHAARLLVFESMGSFFIGSGEERLSWPPYTWANARTTPHACHQC